MTPAAWRRAGGALVAAVGAAAGCELQEVTVAEPDDLVVVEAIAQYRPSGGSRIFVILHRSFGPGDGTVPGADVRVTRADGSGVQLSEMPTLGPCLVEGASPESDPARGTCYRAEPVVLAPGGALRLDIETERGERLEAETVVPGLFGFRRPATLLGRCTLEPDRPFELSWGPSEGAWAYVAETEIFGLPAALEPLGITLDVDPLYLLGLSVGRADTTIVFPSEFGVFDRFDLDRDVALYLQGGVPPATASRVTVAAVDRNYTNWVRGGNFNPSGTVRVPSVRGDGTGFFGSAYRLELELVVDPAPGGGTYAAPSCAGG